MTDRGSDWDEDPGVQLEETQKDKESSAETGCLDVFTGNALRRVLYRLHEKSSAERKYAPGVSQVV